MKILFILAFFCACVATGYSQQITDSTRSTTATIQKLIDRKDFFAARKLYLSQRATLDPMESLKSGAAIDNVFNRLDSSNHKISLLLSRYRSELSPADCFQLLKIKQMNHSKLFEYRQAFLAINELLVKYDGFMSDAEVDDYRNTRTIWATLARQPKQAVHITENTALTIHRDKAGLQNLEVTLDTLSINFIFDTGANLSTVTESTARRLHMTLLDSLIEVVSITGLKIKSRIAVCPRFNLGHITIEHAVFLVFPDSALAIPQINFQIQGIIGFPVIEALGEIQLTRTGEFIVPLQQSVYPHQNMAIDFLNPVIDLDGETYTFDSGANSTMLYDRYYEKYRSHLDSLYKETTISIGGAGGSISRKGYLVHFNATVGGRDITLDSVQLFKEPIKDDDYFYGNIGQDLIRKFHRMTLNFRSMFIRFD